MKYHLLSAAILLVAFGLYALGTGAAGRAFLLIGMVHEAWFWVRLKRRLRAPFSLHES